jgi:CubicO group peptidase (beta-lactamase class C family)
MSLLTVDNVASGWEPVRAAFLEGFEKDEEHGAGVAVYHRGECVVDLVGGWRDKDHTVPYDADALQVVFSTTKGITSIAVAMCVERGLLDYSEKVATYWPSLLRKGKVTSPLRNFCRTELACTPLMATSPWKKRSTGTQSLRDLRQLHHDFPLTPLTVITPSHSVGWLENLFAV